MEGPSSWLPGVWWTLWDVDGRTRNASMPILSSLFFPSVILLFSMFLFGRPRETALPPGQPKRTSSSLRFGPARAVITKRVEPTRQRPRSNIVQVIAKGFAECIRRAPGTRIGSKPLGRL